MPLVLISLIGSGQPQPRGYTAAQLNALRGFGRSIASGKSAASINEEWRIFFTANAKLNPDSAIQVMCNEARTVAARRVSEAAEKVRMDSLLIAAYEQEKSGALKALTPQNKLQPGVTITRKYFEPTQGPNAKVMVRQKGLIRTPEELQAYLREIDDSLEHIGEDAQKANVDMQNQLQKQQQTMQMIGEVSKLVAETALNVIRKIGG